MNDIHCRSLNGIYYVKESKRWQEPKRLACQSFGLLKDKGLTFFPINGEASLVQG